MLGIDLEYSACGRRGVRAPQRDFFRNHRRIAAYWPRTGIVQINRVNRRAGSLAEAVSLVGESVASIHEKAA